MTDLKILFYSAQKGARIHIPDEFKSAAAKKNPFQIITLEVPLYKAEDITADLNASDQEGITGGFFNLKDIFPELSRDIYHYAPNLTGPVLLRKKDISKWNTMPNRVYVLE